MIPIYQHSASNPWRASYSPELNIDTWSRDGIVFQAFKDETEGSVPVYRFHRTDPVWRFYLSTSKTPEPGWTSDGVKFFAFPTPVPGSVPIHRFHADRPWRVLYSTGETAGAGWNHDGIAFHAMPGDLTLHFDYRRINYDNVESPTHTRPVLIIDKKRWTNDSPAEISETIKKSITRTSSFKWGLSEKLKLGIKAEFGAGIPAIASTKAEISAQVEIGGHQEWASSVSETFAIERTIKLAQRAAIEVSAYVEWADDYRTPFTIEFDFWAESSSSGKLDNKSLRKLLELGAFTGTAADGDQPGHLVVKMRGEFEGSFGIKTVINVDEVPLAPKSS